jgi:hypothetical protein
MNRKEYVSPFMTLVAFTEDVVRTSATGVWDITTKEWVEGDLVW